MIQKNALLLFKETLRDHAECMGWTVNQTRRLRRILSYFFQSDIYRPDMMDRLQYEIWPTIPKDQPGNNVVDLVTEFTDHVGWGAWDFLALSRIHRLTLIDVMGILAVKWDGDRRVFCPVSLANDYDCYRFIFEVQARQYGDGYDSETWKNVKISRAMQGLPNISRRPYGYDLVNGSQLVPKPVEFNVLRFANLMYVATANVRSTAEWLDEAGHVTQSGKPWLGVRRQDGDAVRTIVYRNRTSRGKIRFAEEWIEGIHMPIVSPALDKAVEATRAERRVIFQGGMSRRGERLWREETAALNEIIEQSQVAADLPKIDADTVWSLRTTEDVRDAATALMNGRSNDLLYIH
mgnify:CR=1 FL=1